MFNPLYIKKDKKYTVVVHLLSREGELKQHFQIGQTHHEVTQFLSRLRTSNGFYPISQGDRKFNLLKIVEVEIEEEPLPCKVIDIVTGKELKQLGGVGEGYVDKPVAQSTGPAVPGPYSGS